MHPDRALPGLATGRTVQIRAKCVLRVHRCSPIDMSWIPTSNRRARGPVTSSPSADGSPDPGSLWSYPGLLALINGRPQIVQSTARIAIRVLEEYWKNQ